MRLVEKGRWKCRTAARNARLIYLTVGLPASQVLLLTAFGASLRFRQGAVPNQPVPAIRNRTADSGYKYCIPTPKFRKKSPPKRVKVARVCDAMERIC